MATIYSLLIHFDKKKIPYLIKSDGKKIFKLMLRMNHEDWLSMHKEIRECSLSINIKTPNIYKKAVNDTYQGASL